MRGLIVPIALLVTALAAPALATPTDDVKNAFIGFGQLTSYHFAVEANGKSGEGDVVVPDKMQMTFGPTKIIGTSTWVFVSGHWMQMPGTADSMGRMTGGLSAAQSYAAANPKDITVTDLYEKRRRRTLHLYSVQNKGNSTPEHGDVGSDGRVHRIDTESQGKVSIVRFSMFNESITIAAPQ